MRGKERERKEKGRKGEREAGRVGRKEEAGNEGLNG